MWLSLLAACSEYDFAHHVVSAKPQDTDSVEVETGSWPPPGDTAADVCYSPADGYALDPAARILTTDDHTPITIEYLSSDAGYTNELWVDSPVSTQLAIGGQTADGATLTVGPFPTGTEVVFADHVEDTGDHWQSGPASRNGDGLVHGAATYQGSCSWIIGFEDTSGGGDQDYNDIIMLVSGMLEQVDD